MEGLQNSKKHFTAKTIALVGIAAATLECGKLALSFLPNVEVVTLLLALYGYVFGSVGVAAAVVFVLIEPLIYGFGTWVITYFIYWPLVAVIFMLLGRTKLRSRWLATGAALLLTLFFGMLSSFVDVAVLMGFTKHFWSNLALYYVRGAAFYAVQVACNAVLFPLLFEYLARKLAIIRRRMLR